MKLFVKVILILSCGCILFPAQATETPFKIGVIDMNEVLQKSPQRQALATELQNEFTPQRKLVMDLDKELQKLEEKAKRDGTILSQAERNQLEQTLLEKRKDLKRAQENYQEDLALQENKKAQKLFQEIGTLIDEMAQKEHYDLIVRREAAPFYVSKRVDITEKVVQALQQGK
ncbi:MAG: OmpH family outer membrane protein [Gammaproteobacteria bacterium]|nr:OmpH family outer membrane protein [Gammaproteobacteria bacterium]